MHFFEEAAKARQPFAALGEEPPPVLTWPEMQEAIALDDDLEEPVRAVAPEIYLHWQKGRVASGNTPLQPALRIKIIETATDVDDNDPYVCFRRREPRLTRKTRGRDAQSAEKLRRLRRELEEARSLVALVHQRELAKKEQLAMDSTLFDQRAKMRKLKRSLPLPYREGDEDLLVNQKVRQLAPSSRTPALTVSPPAARQEEAVHHGADGPGGVRPGLGAAANARPWKRRASFGGRRDRKRLCLPLRFAGREEARDRARDCRQEAAAHQVERELC